MADADGSRPIAMLFNGVWSQFAVATAPKYRAFFELLYVHEFDTERLAPFRGLVIPFQNDHDAIAKRRDAITRLLASGGRVAVFGNGGEWLGARWESRPVDNAWWLRTPSRPPVEDTDFAHPLFAGLTPRECGYHHHGVYTRIPDGARVLQRSRDREIVSWSTTRLGGELFVGTQDPIVEHGVQQIQHLDRFVDQLVWWLCGRRPDAGRMTIDADAYGRSWPASP